MTSEGAAGPAQQPLVFVHAHPDDETLTTGLTMAHYARAGHPVHLLTCTLGDEGEVIPAELAHLDSAHDDALGPHRREELRRAMAVLGVQHEVLGERPDAGVLARYRDSGMAGTASAAHPAAFVNADVAEAAELVGEVIRRLRPVAVVTYDRYGGYGHPDHIQAHRVTCAALAALSQDRPPLYAVLTPRSWARADRAWLAAHPVDPRWDLPHPDGEYPPSVVDDGFVTHELLAPELVPVQAQALREHRTQVTVAQDGLTYALSNDIAARLPGREGFALVDPSSGELAAGRRGGPRHTGIIDGVQR
ncbi:N-acetyl-1-D-myo-inositol-2-amino-2-deoxy-alpha-D-glucopyranoside deacetylase [Nostocoides sp. HKS02]|uniref:N-acetyl-1-D-myo-inositol-2-amino-2-deoxy-alpha- D-glucopyranoside deacetylase n=1 Tax=Nostocoides sp. HKS02 TaxID=1813880 RepID=UPI0012B4D127|nr:N-acetyl-1-D-myo-inositol-2-amino-2-deoxy-alpha-D-glucopyranoside deacetylase [Tetrasphaera sp. HKS02]QGN58171.1 N-acetyl-1-D-myo-inositol-2-amino-2-deoxy-alpha-D-glucopyranoside deacetylase [Tetrasphaera sp. HKS02]